jgi:hypothetical protein
MIPKPFLSSKNLIPHSIPHNHTVNQVELLHIIRNIFRPHNPKVGSSNLSPATIIKTKA